MGKKLTSNVYVDDVLYVKGAEPPKAVAAKITNPKAWDGDEDSDSGEGDEPSYGDLRVPELKELIADRNDGREEDDLISVEGVKADLVAALEADDVAQAAKSDDAGDEN